MQVPLVAEGAAVDGCSAAKIVVLVCVWWVVAFKERLMWEDQAEQSSHYLAPPEDAHTFRNYDKMANIVSGTCSIFSSLLQFAFLPAPLSTTLPSISCFYSTPVSR
jgi:hypothetical protein